METPNAKNFVFIDKDGLQFHIISYLSHQAATEKHLEILSGVFKNYGDVSTRRVTQFVTDCNDEKTLYFGVRLVDHWISEYKTRLAADEQSYICLINQITERLQIQKELSTTNSDGATKEPGCNTSENSANM
jgi:hypothetical protein